MDLVLEDHKAEETERVRARKEGGSAWNEDETKHFVRTYDDHDDEDFVREGFDPTQGEASAPGESNFAIDDDSTPSASASNGEGSVRSSRNKQDEGNRPEEALHWDDDTGTRERSSSPPGGTTKYGSLGDTNVWNSPRKGK